MAFQMRNKFPIRFKDIMSESGRWWLPITIAAIAAASAFQIMTRSESEATEEPETLLTVPEEQSFHNDKPLEFAESKNDTEIDKSVVARDFVNVDTILDESYYDVYP